MYTVQSHTAGCPVGYICSFSSTCSNWSAVQHVLTHIKPIHSHMYTVQPHTAGGPVGYICSVIISPHQHVLTGTWHCMHLPISNPSTVTCILYNPTLPGVQLATYVPSLFPLTNMFSLGRGTACTYPYQTHPQSHVYCTIPHCRASSWLHMFRLLNMFSLGRGTACTYPYQTHPQSHVYCTIPHCRASSWPHMSRHYFLSQHILTRARYSMYLPISNPSTVTCILYNPTLPGVQLATYVPSLFPRTNMFSLGRGTAGAANRSSSKE